LTQKDYREHIRELEFILEKSRELYETIRVDSLKQKLGELEKEIQKENFWQDKERFTEVNREISRLRRKISPWEGLIKDEEESLELMELALEEDDRDLLEDITARVPSFEKRFDELESIELFTEEEDTSNVFLSIHPGAGGTESQDWANMLFRMYYRWAEQKSFGIEVIDYTPGEEAGIKSATILIKGEYALCEFF